MMLIFMPKSFLLPLVLPPVAAVIPFVANVLDNAAGSSEVASWFQIALQGGFAAVLVLILLKVIPFILQHVQSVHASSMESLKMLQDSNQKTIETITAEHRASFDRIHDEHRKTIESLITSFENRSQTWQSIITQVVPKQQHNTPITPL